MRRQGRKRKLEDDLGPLLPLEMFEIILAFLPLQDKRSWRLLNSQFKAFIDSRFLRIWVFLERFSERQLEAIPQNSHSLEYKFTSPKKKKQKSQKHTSLTPNRLKMIPESVQRMGLKGALLRPIQFQIMPRALQCLVLEDCTGITAEGLQALPVTLLRLSLVQCKEITAEGLRALPRGLTHLNLEGIRLGEEEVLRSLPPSLRHLSTRGWDGLTDKVELLPPGLRCLNVTGCYNLKAESLIKMPRSVCKVSYSGGMGIGEVLHELGYRHTPEERSRTSTHPLALRLHCL